MEPGTVTIIIDWLSNHPGYTSLFIFLIAMTESLAVVGLLMPGVVLMFIIGAYVATGQYTFIDACSWAFLGAVTGDAISYYLGRRYQHDLLRLWPLSRYPDSLQKGSAFFKRHGNKSVLLGRFVGPLRPIIPAIAGSFAMPIGQFLISNILSALLWAPIVLLPGYAFGLSFEIASAVLGRLVLVLLLFISISGFILWLARKCYLWVLPRAEQFVQRLLDWSQQHPIMGKLPSSLLATNQSDLRAMMVLCVLFVVLLMIFFIIPILTPLSITTESFDLVIQNISSSLRSPATDQIIHWILDLYRLPWLFLLCVLSLILLFWKKNFQLIRYALLGLSLPYIVQIFYPQSIFAVCVYAFLSMIFALGHSHRQRRVIYGATLLLICSVFIAELYSGRVTAVPALFAILFSLLWISVLALAYRHHATDFNFNSTQQFITAASIIVLLILQFTLYSHKPVEFSNNKPTTSVIAALIWRESVWQYLPHYRQDFLNQNHYPFNLQWADDIKTIHRILTTTGWTRSSTAKSTALLQWIKPSASITDLPILPHLHHGQYENLRYTRINKTQQKITVIRLWPSHYKIHYSKSKFEIRVPLWIGSYSNLVVADQFGLRYLKTQLEPSIDLTANKLLIPLQITTKKAPLQHSKHSENSIQLISSHKENSKYMSKYPLNLQNNRKF